MTPDELEQIRERLNLSERTAVWEMDFTHVRALLVEVDRLTVANQHMASKCAAADTFIAALRRLQDFW
jgi:hypothetical protein